MPAPKGKAQRSKKKVHGHGVKGNDVIWIGGRCGQPIPSYQTWKNMLERCYCEKFHVRRPAYIGCTVCKEWKEFGAFKTWFDANHREGFQLDKDILVPGNKVYSPSRCIFVPQEINLLFTDSRRSRGAYPRGVCLYRNRYRADCSVAGKQKFLGSYDTPEEASNAYRAFKLKHICELATRYCDDGLISSTTRDALLSYKIDD